MVVAMGISTVVAVATGYAIVGGMSTNQSAQASAEIQATMNQLKSSILQVGRRCGTSVAFVTPVPAAALDGSAGPVTTPVRLTLPTGEIVENNSTALQGHFEIVSAELARAEYKGTDASGNSIFQGFIEVRARIGKSGSDDGKTLLKKMNIGSMTAVINSSGNFVDCFMAGQVPANSMCARLQLQYDAVRNSCKWDLDMATASGSNCGVPNQPIVGITTGSKRCDRRITNYCTGVQYVTGLKKGRSICSDPPATVTSPSPAPSSSPVVITPVPPPTGPAPVVAPGAQPPPQCSQITANQNCQSYCFDYFMGGSCATTCPALTGAADPCAVVESSTTPPALPPATAPAPDPRPVAGQCTCGATTINPGQYCGFCYRDIEDFDGGGYRRIGYVVREESYQCSAGTLVYSVTPNPNRGNCTGAYEVW